jgi:hypothetical protein
MIELLLICGFDTLEYSMVNTTIASVCLQIILWLGNANKDKLPWPKDDEQGGAMPHTPIDPQ